MINKIKDKLELRLEVLEKEDENIETLSRRAELIETLLTINKIEQENGI